jgi:hypothetical protein
MFAKSLFSLVALVALSSASIVACAASAEEPSAEAAGASEDLTISKSLTSCTLDADCVAVARGGCCSNGFLEAVNKDKVSEYEESTKCTASPRPFCPLFVIHDTRVAECDTAKRTCKMVQPQDIQCGGFVANLHECPEGFECSFVGTHPDMPGKCVQK